MDFSRSLAKILPLFPFRGASWHCRVRLPGSIGCMWHYWNVPYQGSNLTSLEWEEQEFFTALRIRLTAGNPCLCTSSRLHFVMSQPFHLFLRIGPLKPLSSGADLGFSFCTKDCNYKAKLWGPFSRKGAGGPWYIAHQHFRMPKRSEATP
jgi:hypothetical protein